MAFLSNSGATRTIQSTVGGYTGGTPLTTIGASRPAYTTGAFPTTTMGSPQVLQSQVLAQAARPAVMMQSAPRVEYVSAAPVVEVASASLRPLAEDRVRRAAPIYKGDYVIGEAPVVYAQQPAARRPVLGANWKCNPATRAQLDDLIANINACDTSGCDVYVCPSPLHVDYCSTKFTNGAQVTPQNCNFKGLGAFTGEMAVEQMKDLGITNVLIGHSERRGEFGILPMDIDETLATKLKYILDAGMNCAYCIGEPLEIREQGLDAVIDHLDRQLTQVYDLLDPARVVLAYEPVWAIGTGQTATAGDAQLTHEGIRNLIANRAGVEVADAIRIQYGGSANAKNAGELSAMPDIDGFLVGGASLKPEFKDMVATISAAKRS